MSGARVAVLGPGAGVLAALALAGCVGQDIRGDEDAVVVTSGENAYAVLRSGRSRVEATIDGMPPLYLSDEQFSAEALAAMRTATGCEVVDFEYAGILAEATLEC